MIKRNGQRLAAIAIAATLLSQNLQPIFAEVALTEETNTEITLNVEDTENVEEEFTQEEDKEIVEEKEEETAEEENEEVVEESEEAEELDTLSEDDETEEEKTTIDFKVMATSDLHANLMNYDYYTGETTNNSGLVKAATVIKEQKELANQKQEDSTIDNALLVDNGDTIQGTPLAHLFAVINPVKPGEKYPVYEALESLGFDVTNIGNHEVNYGMDFIKQIVNDNTSMATVCANIRDAVTGKVVFDPYKIINETVVDSKGNERTLKIGVTGVVPTQILNWDKVILDGEIVVDEMDEAVAKYTKIMKEQEGADIVVVLAHTGYGNETTDVKGVENAGYAISMVDGVDVVVGGHVHSSFTTEIVKEDGDRTQYVQPLNNGREVGVVDLKIDVVEDENGSVEYKINDDETTITNVSARNKDNDAATEAVVKNAHEATDAYVNEKSGEVTKDLNSFFTLVADDPSIQIVSDAQRDYVEKLIEGGDEALAPYANLPILSAAAPFKAGSSASNYVDIKAGGLAIRDLSNLYKFDNTVTVIKLTGSDVKEWLEFCANMFNTIDPTSEEEQVLISSSFPTFNFDVIDGVEYEVDVTKEPKYNQTGQLLNADSSRIYNLTYNGEPIDLDQEFLIATNNYRAGGNNFPWNGRQKIVYSSTDESRDVLKQYIEAAGKLEPTVDNNWSFKAVETAGEITFTSHENGANYLDEYPAISTKKEAVVNEDGSVREGLYTYYYDLAYSAPVVDEEEKEEENNNNGGTVTPEEDKEDENNTGGTVTPEEDKEENKDENTNQGGSSDESPKTGDAGVMGAVALGAVAVVGLAAVGFNKRKED